MRRAAALGLAASLALGGCTATGQLAGLASGGVVGAATANPALAYAVGVGVATLADEAVKYYGRRRQQAEQNAIAAVAGPLGEGQSAAWHIRHDIPYGNEHGVVQVGRSIATPLADCREIIFSVEAPPAAPAWYTSSICHRADRWKWAAAEPAVPRWGLLQ